MDTHHPHHPAHKKKWTEYLLEFFMLFFAVFLGFIAENIRENVIERHREKEFMSSLVRDLELDTAELSQGHIFRHRKILAMDSLINILSMQTGSNLPLSVFRTSRRIFGARNFYQSTGTLDQLKNSGLRLIHNRKVVDSIESYDVQVRRMTKRDEYENEYFAYNARLSEKLYDTRPAMKYLLPQSKLIPDSSTSIKLNLAYLPEYLNDLLFYRTLLTNNDAVFERNKHKAANLIALIQKEYHLQNE